MATGMKHWLGLTAAGVVAVALLGLPPREPNIRERPGTAQDHLARELQREIVTLNRELKRVRVQDSLRAVLAESGDAATGIATGHAPAVDSVQRRKVVDRRLVADATALPGRDPDVLLGAFWVPAGQGDHPEMDRRRFGSSYLEWYGGELEDGRPYCMITIPVPAESRGWYAGLELPPVLGSRLGPCAYWGRFGPPGASIERWLAAGAVNYTVGHAIPESSLRLMEPARPGPFGKTSWPSLAVLSPYAERCLAGDREMCAALFMTVGDVPADPSAVAERLSAEVGPADEPFHTTGYLGRLSRYAPPASLGLPGNVLMADLERAFGADALRAFWTSEKRVDHAFRDAFGVEVGPWTQEWLAGYYPAVRAGTATYPRPFNALSVLLLGALVAGVASFTARRRQVG